MCLSMLETTIRAEFFAVDDIKQEVGIWKSVLARYRGSSKCQLYDLTKMNK